MKELVEMLAQVKADRKWFHDEAKRTRIHGMFVDAAACAIREKALTDAIAAIKRIKKF